MRPHDRITKRIWLGGSLTFDAWRCLWQAGVTVDLSLQEEARDDFGPLAPEAELWLPATDNDMPSHDQTWLACAFIHSALLLGRHLVIHCRWGIGRSPLTLAAYLTTQGWDAGEAMRSITERRPIVEPNGGQRDQLLAFVRRWRAGELPPLPGPPLPPGSLDPP